MIDKKKAQKVLKEVGVFILIAFTISWSIWFVEIKIGKKLFLAPFGPSIAGLIVAYKENGVEGLKKMLKRVFSLNFDKVWLLPVFFLMPSLVFISYVLGCLIDNIKMDFSFFSNPLMILYNFVIILFLGGPLCEELGWRGYMLEKFQKIYTALDSSVYVGFVWGLWHIPLFFMINQEIYKNIPFLGFVLGAIFLSIVFTWIYNNTNKSIFAVILFHTSSNISQLMFPMTVSKTASLISLILNIALVVILLVIFKKESLKIEKK